MQALKVPQVWASRRQSPSCRSWRRYDIIDPSVCVGGWFGRTFFLLLSCLLPKGLFYEGLCTIANAASYYVQWTGWGQSLNTDLLEQSWC